MKKVIALMLSLALVFTLFGCEKKSSADDTPKNSPGTSSSTPNDTPDNTGTSDNTGKKSYETIVWDEIIPVYSMASGAAYVMNGAFVDLATKYMPGVTFVAEATSGSYEMMNLLEERAENGQAALSLSASDGAYMARLGLGLYADDPLTEVYQTSFLFSNEIWLTVPKGSGIQSYSDVVGKRIGVGPVGSSISVLTEAMLNASGVTLDDFEAYNVNYEGITSGLRDGSLDGGFFGGPPPFAAYEELAGNMDIIPIGPSDDAIEAVLEECPYYMVKTLEAGVMEGVEEDINMLAFVTNINMNSAISDELAYAILEMLYDHEDEVRSYSTYARDFTLENWSKTVCAEMHPGAIKFYQDKGVYDR